MIEKAYNDFIGKGYTIDNSPNKRECFEAGFEEGYKYAMELFKAPDNEKKEVATIIRDWHAKFEGEK